MNKYFAVVLLTACLMLPAVAQADVFSFEYADPTTLIVQAHGLITGGETAPGSGIWSITNVTGVRNGKAITFIPGNSPGLVVDDLLYVPPTPVYLSVNLTSGFIIQTADGIFNPSYYGSDLNYHEDLPGVTGPIIGFSAQGPLSGTVPEPTSILLMGTLLLGVAGALKRKLA